MFLKTKVSFSVPDDRPTDPAEKIVQASGVEVTAKPSGLHIYINGNVFLGKAAYLSAKQSVPTALEVDKVSMNRLLLEANDEMQMALLLVFLRAGLSIKYQP